MSNVPARRRPSMLSPPVPALIPVQWAEKINTVWSLGPHPVATKNQAREVLERIAPFSEPVAEDLVQAWIAPVIASVSNPRPKDEAAAWFAALMLALDGLPCGAFTEATQRDLLRRCTHWPSTAEVYAVVADATGRIWEDIAGLRRVIAAPTKSEGDQP
jgi:hypothetical protein